MFAFPKNGQGADQQLKDESDCYGMAKQRTGIDAQTPPPKGLSEEEKKAAKQQAADNAKQAQGNLLVQLRDSRVSTRLMLLGSRAVALKSAMADRQIELTNKTT